MPDAQFVDDGRRDGEAPAYRQGLIYLGNGVRSLSDSHGWPTKKVAPRVANRYLKRALVLISVARKELVLGDNVLIETDISLIALDRNVKVGQVVVGDRAGRPIVRQREEQCQRFLRVGIELAGGNLIVRISEDRIRIRGKIASAHRRRGNALHYILRLLYPPCLKPSNKER